jgi:predicted RNase H-like HicB family nuclease
MQITVLIEPKNGNGYRASNNAPFGASAEGTTREEALKKLQDEIQAQLRSGAEIVAMELPVEPHPLLKYAGILKDNPLLEEWKQAMAEYRDQIEKDDDYL